jgi:hypothetical protein
VGFFEDLPQMDQPDDDQPEMRMPEWFGPPKDVLGAVVPLSEVILRTERVFVGLRTLTAYPTGLAVDLVLAGRRQGLSRKEWQVVHDAFLDLPHRRSASPNPGALRIGMELADGTRLGTHQRHGLNPFRDSPPPPVLSDHGGRAGGGSQTVDRHIELWLWPLPSDAALSLVLQWPDLDIPLTHHPVDLKPVQDAVGRATPYWP